MEYRKLKRSKVVFIDTENRELSLKDINSFLKEAKSQDEKWFFRGCKHILERHYTEAIKNLQLSNTKDALLMIIISAFKLADEFLMEEYLREIKNYRGDFSIFNKYNFYPFFKYEENFIRIDKEDIHKLLLSILNR